MRHQSATPSAILRPESQCFQIPPFQRNYSWSASRIQKLIYDIGVAATQEPKHWIGIMLAGPAPESGRCLSRDFGHQCWIILDGQQRALTLRMVLLAISDEIERQTGQYPIEIDRARLASIKVHGLDEEDWGHIERGETAQHRDHAIEQPDGKLRICDAYLYIRWILLAGTNAVAEEEALLPPPAQDGPLIKQWATEGVAPLSPRELLVIAETIMTKLELSLLIHEESDEPVEVIFESLNGLRTELGQYDLFRNFILTQANVQGEEQKNLYTELMQGPEQAIDRASLDYKDEKGNLQVFLSDFVAVRSGFDGSQIRAISRNNSSQRFKEWWQGGGRPPLREFIREDLSPKMRCWLAASSGAAGIASESGPLATLPRAAVRSIWRIELFSRGTYTPLTTLAFESWLSSSDARRDEVLTQVLHSIETVLAREVLSGSSTKGRRNRMQDALPRLVGSSAENSLAWAAEVAPTDHMVRRAALQSNNTSHGPARPREDWFVPKDLFQRSRPRAIFALFDGLVQFRDGLEYSTVLALKPGTRSRGAGVRTIEHLCPQAFLGSKDWLNDLRDWGVDHEDVDNRLHCIGNLTVLPRPINAAWQRSSASSKRAAFETDDFPSLKINKEFLTSERWGPDEIDARSEALVNDCLSFWSIPN